MESIGPDIRADRATEALKIDISKITLSSLLLHVIGTCSDSKPTVGFMKKIRGVTVGLGYATRQVGGCELCASPNMLLIMRKTHYDKDDIDIMSMNEQIEMASVKICANRYLMRKWKPTSKDHLMFQPLESITSHMRMFQAVHHIGHLPTRVRHILYGDLIPQFSDSGEIQLLNRRRDVAGSGTSESSLRSGVDSDVLEYLQSLTERSCNDSQKKSILMCTIEMGSPSVGFSSMCAIVGPPGTGKTTSIRLLVGALLHPKEVGHIGTGEKEINLLIVRDGFQRAEDHSNQNTNMLKQ